MHRTTQRVFAVFFGLLMVTAGFTVVDLSTEQDLSPVQEASAATSSDGLETYGPGNQYIYGTRSHTISGKVIVDKKYLNGTNVWTWSRTAPQGVNTQNHKDLAQDPSTGDVYSLHAYGDQSQEHTYLTKLNQADGSQVWTYTESSFYPVKMSVGPDGTVFMVQRSATIGDDYRLQSISPSGGSNWEISFNVAGEIQAGQNGVVYRRDGDTITKYDSAGNPVWSISATNVAEWEGGGSMTDPVSGSGFIISNNNTTRIDGTATVQWNKQHGETVRTATDDQYVYSAEISSPATLYIYDDTGSLFHQREGYQVTTGSLLPLEEGYSVRNGRLVSPLGRLVGTFSLQHLVTTEHNGTAIADTYTVTDTFKTFAGSTKVRNVTNYGGMVDDLGKSTDKGTIHALRFNRTGYYTAASNEMEAVSPTGTVIGVLDQGLGGGRTHIAQTGVESPEQIVYIQNYYSVMKVGYTASTTSKKWEDATTYDLYDVAARSGDFVVIANASGMIGLEGSDGSERWTVAPDEKFVSVAHAEYSFGLTDTGVMYKVDPATGEVKWKQNVIENGNTIISANDGYIYASSTDGKIKKISPVAGNTMWAVRVSNGADDIMYDGSKGVLYSSSSGSVIAINSTGDPMYALSAKTALNIRGVRTNENVTMNVDGPDGKVIDGVVKTQNDKNVSSATVEIWGYTNTSIGDPVNDTEEELIEKSNEALDNISRMYPSTWKSSVDEMSSLFTNSDLLFGQRLEDAEAGYVPLVYTQDDIPRGKYHSDPPDLTRPAFKEVPADEDLYFFISNLGSTGGLLGEDELDQQVPGSFTKRGDFADAQVTTKNYIPSVEYNSENAVIVTPVDGYGDKAGESYKIWLNSTYVVMYGVPVSATEFGVFQLPPGQYRLTPEIDGKVKDRFSYMVHVGDLEESRAAIQSDVTEPVSNELTAQSEKIVTDITQTELIRQRISSDSDGQFRTAVDQNLEVVQVQAYKKPEGMGKTEYSNFDSAKDVREKLDVQKYTSFQNIDPGLLSMSDVREFHKNTDYLGSYYLPGKPVRVEPPESGVVVRVVEVGMPTFGSLDKYGVSMDQFWDWLSNQNWLDIGTGIGIPGDDIFNDEEFKDKIRNLDDRYELDWNNTTIDDTTTPTDIVNNIRNNDTNDVGITPPGTGGGGGGIIGDTDPPDAEWTNTTISITIPYSGELIPDSTAVVVTYPELGYSENVEDKYVTVDKRFGNDAVIITEYPLPKGANVTTWDIIVASEDDDDPNTGNEPNHDKFTITRPGWGSPLSLRSVVVSTTTPGPSENVTVRANPESVGIQVTDINLSVSAPGRNPQVWDNDTSPTATFRTGGTGAYFIAMELTDATGNTWVETLAVKAAPTQVDQPPTVSIRNGFLGPYALVGDGLNDGRVRQVGPGEFTVTAISESGEVPSSVHFYMSDAPASAEIMNLVVQQSTGTDSTSIQRQIGVYVHTRYIPKEAIVYRNSKEPITRSGTAYGSYDCQNSSGCMISTYSDSSGKTTIQIIEDPSFIEEAWFWIRVNIPFTV